jgi:hypothetical protein
MKMIRNTLFLRIKKMILERRKHTLAVRNETRVGDFFETFRRSELLKREELHPDLVQNRQSVETRPVLNSNCVILIKHKLWSRELT